MNNKSTENNEATENEKMTEEMWREKIRAAKEEVDKSWAKVLEVMPDAEKFKRNISKQ